MDFRYRREGGDVYAEVPFALFLAGLAPFFERLLLMGRVVPGSGRLPHRLPAGTELVDLPLYDDASKGSSLVRALLPTMAAFVRALRQVDGVLVFGPSPFSLLLALTALAMRRRVVIGVRQDYAAYVRHRHPGRRALHVAASLLEKSWRALSRLVPVLVVGADLGQSYRRARRLLEVTVTLVGERDLVPLEEAVGKSYDGDLRVLSVGRLDPEKNPLLLADVMAALMRDGGGWRLIVCGEGSLEDHLAGRLADLGVAQNTELRGYVPVDDGLRALYRDSHMLLHVSLTEGMPQVLYEAFAAGLPVVATEVGGVGRGPERPALMLVPPGDAEAAAAALRRVADDPGLRSQMVRGGLELARRRTLESECERVGRFVGEGGRL
jgi:glycosyltransferase involved in cell wall biosynthesis